ncbi:CHASE2 domain-containing protein [Pseudomonas protegens]|uniref:CHASE2 domain-containing protein n=1 Tax=Pseudomonas protegens TaxID=380021 RepID=UPI0031583645
MKILDVGRTKLPRNQAWQFRLMSLALVLLVCLAGLREPSPVMRLDRAIFDTLLTNTASNQSAPDTMVVDIDEVSLAAVGQWPWPRYRIAALVDGIAAAQPSAMALDVLLPEADRTSLAEIQRALKQDFNINVGFTGVPAGLMDNDGYLGHRMAQADALGARYFYFDHTTKDDQPLRPGGEIEGRVDLLLLNQASGVLDNVDEIARQIRYSGFVNVRHDDDELLRQMPLLIAYKGIVHPSLALAATMRALDVSSARVESNRDGLSLRVGPHEVPLDSSGYVRLRFNGPASRYRSISAIDVLAGRVRAEDLRGKIVFVGSSAVGLHDIHITAVDRRFSGLKLQSVVAQNILDERAVRIPKWEGWFVFALAGSVALLLSQLFVAGYRLAVLAGTSVAAGLVFLALTTTVFLHNSMYLPVAAPLLVLGLLQALFITARLAFHRRQVKHWHKQLEKARQLTIESMAAVAETRDPETGAHIKRTQNYVRAIARRLQHEGHYVDTLTKDYIHLLFLSAPLHDIGKVGVPDAILLKPGPLTDEEWITMRKHPEFGKQIILSTADSLEGDNFLTIASEIAATHHEKWDGTGYPLGLMGQEIPLSGRIMAVADIYDALISRRCYKEPFSHERSITMMRELRGKTFDPLVFDAFIEIEDEIQQIAGEFRDEDEMVMLDTQPT